MEAWKRVGNPERPPTTWVPLPAAPNCCFFNHVQTPLAVLFTKQWFGLGWYPSAPNKSQSHSLSSCQKGRQAARSGRALSLFTCNPSESHISLSLHGFVLGMSVLDTWKPKRQPVLKRNTQKCFSDSPPKINSLWDPPPARNHSPSPLRLHCLWKALNS